MSKKKELLKINLLILIFSLCQEVFCQSSLKIDYFGLISSEIDENMYKMTNDFYYTQLCEIPNFIVKDKRTKDSLLSKPSISEISANSLAFYAEIQKKNGTSKWIATLNVINQSTKETKSLEKEYDSYYKILMESKSDLQDSIKTLINSESKKTTSQTKNIPNTESTNLSPTEKLSGTWTGEDTIDKVVIMRGGRGFVIFKNGASMNISINYYESQNTIEIIQNARPNASFYPEIPRQLALKEAVNAAPIKWTFSLKDDDTLQGTKSTLIANGEQIVQGDIQVLWNRKK